MQTLLDKVVKDAITCIMFHQILGVFIIGLIVKFARSLTDDNPDSIAAPTYLSIFLF